jgi:hypothetical protein
MIELYDAKEVLDKADRELAEHGDALECRDLAYIAHRKLQLVDVKGRTEHDRQTIAEGISANSRRVEIIVSPMKVSTN